MINALLLTDGYKTSHHKMYPEGTTMVFSNWTPRNNKYASTTGNNVLVFGIQMVIKQLHSNFQKFFESDKDTVIAEIKQELSDYLGMDYDVSHFEKLHDLGYLPISIRSLDEGTLCPIGQPMLTIYNTHPDFYWLTNFLETYLSMCLWKGSTSATISLEYKKVLKKWAENTNKGADISFQAHDFSMRGMDSLDAVITSGLAHLTVFKGSDSLPTIHGAREYYGAQGFVAGSVPASEHSVMSAGGKESEIETFRRLLKVYPKGILSVVSDTWDLWKVCTEYLPQLKEEILNRDGKAVIRPDSGDPVDILCGKKIYTAESTDKDDLEYIISDNEELMDRDGDFLVNVNNLLYNVTYGISVIGDRYTPFIHDVEEVIETPEHKGVVELLWDVFGGEINEQGYKVLHPCIGAIYGDSITLERAENICQRLADKGFASTNVVYGIGSFSMHYNTRDTYGFAMKATYTERLEDGQRVGYNITKDPVTDKGKKSAKGLLAVINGEFIQEATWEQVHSEENQLKVRYQDGRFENETTFEEICSRVSNLF